jgi:hypothetical protein
MSRRRFDLAAVGLDERPAGAISSEADTASRREIATNQKCRAGIRFNWVGYRSGATFDRRGLVIALGLALLPCAGMAESEPAIAPSCRDGAKLMARLELVLGARTPRGIVGPRAWARFLATEITPRFPDGLTVLDGYGQWRNRSRGVDRERSRLVLIWYEPDAASEARIEAIRAAYTKQFRQSSVLRVDSTSCVSF